MTKELPALREPLHFHRAFTATRAALLCAGFLPRDMEDRWLLDYRAPWLYMARSWTGFVVFGLELQLDDSGATVQSSWVSRDPEQYRSTDAAHDREQLGKILDVLLTMLEARQNAG